MPDPINLVDKTPHVMIVDHHDNPHVIAVSSIRGVINGTYPPANLGDDVLRRIIQEWLEFTTRNK